LIRETQYADGMTAWRARLHQRIALALEKKTPAETCPVAEIAYHFHMSGAQSAEKTVEYAIVAAGQAHEPLAFEDAARFYRMAFRQSWPAPSAFDQ